VTTPNHPEYPAAHGCVGGATAEVLRRFFRSKRIELELDSRVTNTTHVYASTDELSRELQLARVWGGMHYRRSSAHGAELGKRTAAWTLEQHFRPIR
jgi:hypothetical protein